MKDDAAVSPVNDKTANREVGQNFNTGIGS